MMVTRQTLRRALGAFFVVTTGAGCGGETDFAGSTRQSADQVVVPTPTDTPPVVEPPSEEEPKLETFAALTWHWQCESAPGELPEPLSDDEVLVTGIGPHEFQHEHFAGTPVTFSGELCPPEALARDIVFVIDVSGSMADFQAGNDPLVAGSCARLRAVENVMSTVSAGIGRFGIVTFSNDSNGALNSTQLWADQQELKTDLERSGNGMAAIVCAAAGNTNYQDGLVKARSLLEMGDAVASKEIYFISDGQPNGGQDGAFEASRMRFPGITVQGATKPVTIATVMLGGNDTALESKIASRVDDGMGNLVALHAYVTDTSQLTSVLADLSNNEIAGAQLKYRAIGTIDWSELSLFDHLNGFEFSIPALDLDLTSALDGIEVYYSYKDSHNNLYESGGKLVWVEDAGKADLSLPSGNTTD